MLEAISFKMDAEILGLAVLSAGDAAAFLSGVNPSLFTIRTFRGDWASHQQTASDIHTGMIIGNVLALAVGFAATLVTESWWPFLFTLACAGALDVSYEWALRSPRVSDGQ
jgi:hypothetical protein